MPHISKHVLRTFIKDAEALIEAYRRESHEFPHMKSYHDRLIAKAEGKIEAWKETRLLIIDEISVYGLAEFAFKIIKRDFRP